MKEDLSAWARAAKLLLWTAAFLLCAWCITAYMAVDKEFAPYNAGIDTYNADQKYPHARSRHLNMRDITTPYLIDGRYFPKKINTEPPCGSDCIGKTAIRDAKFGPVSVPWVGDLGLFALALGSFALVVARRDNPRRNIINLGSERIRLKTTADTLPIIQKGWAMRWDTWGLMRRDGLKGGGRKEPGGLFVFGAPGRGKSSLLKWWLTISDALNFIVIDLKQEIWRSVNANLDLTHLRQLELDPPQLNSWCDDLLLRGSGKQPCTLLFP